MHFPVINNPDPDMTPMTMEQYLDFITFINQMSDPDALRKQKEYEEVIDVRFSLPEERIQVSR
jgi:hypothetical protein